jgi:hypothetical protein
VDLLSFPWQKAILVYKNAGLFSGKTSPACWQNVNCVSPNKHLTATQHIDHFDIMQGYFAVA